MKANESSGDYSDSDSEDDAESYLEKVAYEVVPVRHNEEEVTGLSRYMVKKYIQAKDRIRYYSPELKKRGGIRMQILS